MSPVRPAFILIGRRLEPEHHRVRDFLTRIAQPFEWIEAGTPAAHTILEERGLTDPELPVVIEAEQIIEGGTVERLVEEWGGQASHTSLIEKCFPDWFGGAELARLAGRQAERFGAELVLLRGVTGSERPPDGPFTLLVEGDYRVEASVVIAAPGMDWRLAGIEPVG